MDKKREPDPRFKEFTEQFDEQDKEKAIGFTILGSDYVFKYTHDGGWVDEDGRYFNSQGIMQSDEDDDQDEHESFSDRDDQLVDQFEDMLRREEEGMVRKKTPKEEDKKEETLKSEQNQNEETGKSQKKQKEEFDFKKLVENYVNKQVNKQLLRQKLPEKLFIYFRQKGILFEKIKPQIETRQSVDQKNKLIEIIGKSIEEQRQTLAKGDMWLSEQGVQLSYSGDSEQQNVYERYWFGTIKTTPEKYLQLIGQVSKSKTFNLLQYKTFYALKSKFYLKKAHETVKKNIIQLQKKVEAIGNDQAILLRLDNLPENYPLSFVYDLVQFVGGNWEDIEEAHADGQYSAELMVLKDTALKMVNLQAYNHDKGEFIELQVKESRQRVSNPQKRLYWIEVEGKYKLHERELSDTLALSSSRQGLAKHLTLQEWTSSKVRFAVGSVDSLRKVLMFRGSSLNAIHVWPELPKPKPK